MRVLGDILESISGAILVDTQLKLDVVWKKLKPILSPIITPKNMELQPLRELHKLCSYHHYVFNVSIISGEGSNMKKRSTETKAAKHALAQLKVFSNFSVILFLREG